MGKLLQMRDVGELNARRAKIDEYGSIDMRLQLCETDKDRKAVLKAEIDDWYADAPGDCPQVATGNRYVVQLGTRRNERTITDKRRIFNLLKKRLGMDGLIAVLDLPLSVVDKNLTAEELKGLIVQARSGYRTHNVVALEESTGKAA